MSILSRRRLQDTSPHGGQTGPVRLVCPRCAHGGPRGSFVAASVSGLREPTSPLRYVCPQCRWLLGSVAPADPPLGL